MRIAQLAFGILVAAQLAGIADTDLVTTEVDRLGRWAPWVGIVRYGIGSMLFFGPPNRFFPWMILMLTVAYAGQLAGNEFLGSYANGFGGGLVLTIGALAISLRQNAPAPISLIIPGFWLLVPGSLGLMGVTRLLGSHDTTVFMATLISMIAIALGVQTGLALWRISARALGIDDSRLFKS
jgi:uncharacterized membrane protein YjjB (DUF3815 family)